MAIEKIYDYKLENNQYKVTIVSNREVSQEDFKEIKKILKNHIDSNCLVDMVDYNYERLSNKKITIYNISLTQYMKNMCQSINYFRLAYFN